MDPDSAFHGYLSGANPGFEKGGFDLVLKSDTGGATNNDNFLRFLVLHKKNTSWNGADPGYAKG